MIVYIFALLVLIPNLVIAQTNLGCAGIFVDQSSATTACYAGSGTGGCSGADWAASSCGTTSAMIGFVTTSSGDYRVYGYSNGCVPPLVAVNGQCVEPPPSNDCQSLSGQSAMIGGAAAYQVSGSSSSCISGASFSGCAMSCTGGASANGKASCTGCTFTGESVTVADTAQPVTAADIESGASQAGAETACLEDGQGFISLNGITVCTQPTATNPVTTTTKTGTSTTISSSGTTTTTYQDTTINDGTTTTTSTTSTTTSGTGTTTTTSTGTGTTNGTSTLDAAGVAKGVKDGFDTYCTTHPDDMMCVEMGTYTDGNELSTKDIGVTDITPVPIGTTGSCPASVAMPFGGEFSYQIFCDFATGVRPLFIAIAWLISGYIVLGAMRQ